MGGAGSSVAASAVRVSPSAALRSPRRSASQPRFARPTASRLLSPVARACAIEASSSGRTWAYRSAQSSENVACENQVANENHGLPSEPAARALSGQKRAGREVGADLGGLVREDGDERGRGQQLGWRRRIAGGPLAQRLTAEGHRGCGRGVVHPGDDGRGLELERELGVVRIERRRCAIENLDRLREALSAAERERQHHRCLGGCRGVRRGVHGLLQVLGPVGEPGARLGHSEVEQQCRPVARRRWFSERSAQEDRLRLGSALLSRRAGGLDQPLDDPAIGGGLADQQVLGDALVRARLLGEQLGGTAVASSRARRWRAPSRCRCGRSDG